MVRVLHIFAGMNTGGVESFAMNLQEALSGDDVCFDFLLRKEENDQGKVRYFKKHNSKIFTTKPWPRHIVGNYMETRKFFIKHGRDYDWIHVHMNSLTYTLPIRLALKYSRPGSVIVHSHNTRAKAKWMHFFHGINKIWLRHCPVTRVACSEGAGQWMFGKGYRVVPNAVDVRKYTVTREDLEKRDRGVVSLVSVGRLEKQKNYKFMVPVIKQLVKEGVSVKYYIAGKGAQEMRLKRMAKENGLSDKVVFLGNVDDVRALLKMGDIFCMPSLYEGFSISLLEAECSGLPAIVSDNVSEESMLCGNVYKVPLRKEKWVRQIKGLAKMKDRGHSPNNSGQIARSKYGLGGLRESMGAIYGCLPRK